VRMIPVKALAHIREKQEIAGDVFPVNELWKQHHKGK